MTILSILGNSVVPAMILDAITSRQVLLFSSRLVGAVEFPSSSWLLGQVRLQWEQIFFIHAVLKRISAR